MNTIELLKNYDKNKHIEVFSDNNLKYINLKYISSDKWREDKDIPYVLKTHLLDSYYCLPERPDMAFTFLWKCINNSYTELYIKKNPTSTNQCNDAKSIDTLISIVIDNFEVPINTQTTIKVMIDKYIKNIPTKLTRFMANFILKNYVLEKKYRNGNTAGIANKHISNSYTTFKKKFKDIYEHIISTYGEAFEKITDPEIENNTVNLNINNIEKSQQIIKSLGNKLQELLIERKVILQDSEEKNEYHLDLTDDTNYINFIVRNVLYAIRNNTVHGKIASRLNSKTKNKDSYSSSVYIYLLGYMFLTISLYALEYIKDSDLNVNLKNLENNIENI